MEKPRVALTLMGVPIHDVTMDETIAWVSGWIAHRQSAQIATVNPEFLMRARQDAGFEAVLRRAALCIPDGIGIVWAARLRRSALRERVAGSDLVPRLAREASEHGWRVFFLGAAPGVAQAAASILAGRHPGLQIAGCHAGSPAPEEEAGIVRRVKEARTDLLLVAYGAPKQDLWLARNLEHTGAAVGDRVGGSFDFARRCFTPCAALDAAHRPGMAPSLDPGTWALAPTTGASALRMAGPHRSRSLNAPAEGASLSQTSTVW